MILDENEWENVRTHASMTQAKNVVLNVSEMEAKVREATNDDPWCVSANLLQFIRTKVERLWAGGQVPL
jgi:hypothetical protein